MAGRSNEDMYSEAEATAKAFVGTEQEIINHALDKEPDDNDGDQSLEEMDDLDIPVETDESDEAEADDADADDDDPDEADPEPERQAEGRVPPHRLREETARREVAEAEARTAKAERDALNARLTALERAPRQSPETEPQRPTKPDLFADPEGYERYLIAQADQRAQERFLNANLADAQEQHGEKFTAAYKALTALDSQDPTARATVQRIINAPNPGRAVMKWHSEQALLREVGSDPDAYRQRVAREIMQDPEFRKQIVSDMRGEAQRGDGGRPRTQVRIPRSLNEAGGRGGARNPEGREMYDNSEKSVFEHATRR